MILMYDAIRKEIGNRLFLLLFQFLLLYIYNLPSIFHDLHLKDLGFLIQNSNDYFTLKHINVVDKVNAIE